MNWANGFILVLGILLPVGVGLGFGAYQAAQSPRFLAEAGGLILKAVMPILGEFLADLAKRNTPAVEAKMKATTRRAGEWDNFRKKERDR